MRIKDEKALARNLHEAACFPGPVNLPDRTWCFTRGEWDSID
jgi:hypothetical protein